MLIKTNRQKSFTNNFLKSYFYEYISWSLTNKQTYISKSFCIEHSLISKNGVCVWFKKQMFIFKIWTL